MKLWRRKNGQSLVEFALVLPIIILLLFGMIDIGLALSKMQSLHQVTKELARSASVGSTEEELRDLALEYGKNIVSTEDVVISNEVLADGTTSTRFRINNSNGNPLEIIFKPTLSKRKQGNTLHVEGIYTYIPITPLIDDFTEIPLFVETFTRIEVSIE